ncbi:MAG: SIS domain-containing protein [Rhodobacteraceae bacterium]|nr:SIS domain-containing protein [Paracoccaceae bacterium]
MSVLTKILTNLDTMAPADREIGRYIAENPEKMLGLSSAALAAETGRSQSSVVKFSQKLGYASYQDLKLAVSTARAHEARLPTDAIHGSIELGDGFPTVLEKLLGSKVRAVRQTLAANPEAVITRALDVLDAARRISLAGVGASSLVASDFSFKLMKLGRNVVHGGDSHVQMANAAGLEPGDVLFALSYSGTSVETLRIAERAAARGATVIAVTGLQDNALARVADIVLHTVADEDRARSSSITARDAQLALTDLLFLLTVQRQPDADDYIHNSEEAVAALKAIGPGGAARK